MQHIIGLDLLSKVVNKEQQLLGPVDIILTACHGMNRKTSGGTSVAA